MARSNFSNKLNPREWERQRIMKQNERVAKFYEERGLKTTFDVPPLKLGFGWLIIVPYILALVLMVGQFVLAVNVVSFPLNVGGISITFTAVFFVSIVVCLGLFIWSLLLGIKHQDTHKFALATVDIVTNTLPLYSVVLVIAFVALWAYLF